MDTNPNQIILIVAAIAGFAHLIGLGISWRQRTRFRLKLERMTHDEGSFTPKNIMEFISAKYFRPEIPIAGVFVLIFWGVAVNHNGMAFFLAFVYSLFLVFRIFYYLGSGADTDRVEASQELLESLMLEGKAKAFGRLAWALGMSFREQLREVGYKALIQWGSPQAAGWLYNIQETNNPEMLLEGRERGSHLLAAVQEIDCGNWEPLPWLEENYIFWRVLTKDIKSQEITEILSEFLGDEKIPMPARKFIRIVQEMQGKPKVGFCMQDRAKAIKSSVGQLSFLVCPVCHRIDSIQYPVRHVTGEIGGKEGERLEGDTLSLEVWDGLDRFTQLAEVDQLDVFPSENADWALNAFIEAFDNRFSNQSIQIHVHKGVNLSENTRKILKTTHHKIKHA